MNAAIIHTDGACSGNPGPGGYAAIIEINDNSYATITGGDPATTNNRMELGAVIEGMCALNEAAPELGPLDTITVRSDSKYVVDAFNKGWIANWQRNGWRSATRKPVANQELWERLLQEIGRNQVIFKWVKGHSGDPMNERCDRLATAEAAFAPRADGYWVCAGQPRSLIQAR